MAAAGILAGLRQNLNDNLGRTSGLFYACRVNCRHNPASIAAAVAERLANPLVFVIQRWPEQSGYSHQIMQTEIIGTAHENPIHKLHPGQPGICGVKIAEHR